MAKMLYDKLWDDHTVHGEEGGTTALYLERHSAARSHQPPQSSEDLTLTATDKVLSRVGKQKQSYADDGQKFRSSSRGVNAARPVGCRFRIKLRFSLTTR